MVRAKPSRKPAANARHRPLDCHQRSRKYMPQVTKKKLLAWLLGLSARPKVIGLVATATVPNRAKREGTASRRKRKTPSRPSGGGDGADGVGGDRAELRAAEAEGRRHQHRHAQGVLGIVAFVGGVEVGAEPHHADEAVGVDLVGVGVDGGKAGGEVVGEHLSADEVAVLIDHRVGRGPEARIEVEEAEAEEEGGGEGEASARGRFGVGQGRQPAGGGGGRGIARLAGVGWRELRPGSGWGYSRRRDAGGRRRVAEAVSGEGQGRDNSPRVREGRVGVAVSIGRRGTGGPPVFSIQYHGGPTVHATACTGKERG